ncbi:MAG: glycerophosphodiester phosphodiesterase [Bacteroidales bacterium]|jgi:glycerophosphoryl diester phosphodiesterase|nr:glycerophosphodiester phosphodiesterase [Bacteroidales bacterium]
MKIRNITCIVLLAAFSISVLSAQTKVIAHRGYWNCEGSAQNSIASLQKARELHIYGSEFDVWMTSDGVLVVNHDATVEGMRIDDTPYEKLKDIRLKNGEKLPLLEEYLLEGKKDKKTKLILEIKSHNTKDKEDRATAAVVEMVKKTGVKKQTEYIAFSLNVCKELVRLTPKTEIAYLNGDLAPQELKALKISGIDYNLSVLKKNKDWIEKAHQLKMKVNVWTVNKEADMQEMIDAKVDYITTDNPVAARELITKK